MVYHYGCLDIRSCTLKVKFNMYWLAQMNEYAFWDRWYNLHKIPSLLFDFSLTVMPSSPATAI